MGSMGHFMISIGKSAIRIGACVITIAFGDIKATMAWFLIAELLGIAEELVDKRGTKE